MSSFDVRQSGTGEAGITACGQVFSRRDYIQEMMPDPSPFLDRELGRPDIQPLMDLDGIAANDFTAEGFGQVQR